MKTPRFLAATAFLSVVCGLCGCIGYPRIFLAKKSGRAALENGRPVTIRAAIVKECERIEGDTEEITKTKDTVTDSQGRYSLRMFGLAFNWRNFISLSRCTSRVRTYVCREACRPADDVDINMLGK